MAQRERTDPGGKPRLAYAVKYFHPMPRISGILTFVRDLLEELAAHFQIRVLTWRYSRQVPEREEYAGCEIRRLEGIFPWAAGRAARDFQPDLVVFGSGFWRPWYLLPYWELFRAGFFPCPAPVALTQYTNMTGRVGGLLGALHPRPDGVIALTEPEAGRWERRFPGRVRFIPPGVRFRPPSPPPSGFIPAGAGKIRIGYFGHLEAHKGPDRALEAFLALGRGDAELLLHGEGPLEASLRERAGGDPGVIFQGYVPDPDPWIRSCSLAVFPYRSSVSVLGYSRAALEALAAGVPLLVTDSPALAPLVREGVNGHICSGDEDLRRKLGELLQAPEKLAALAGGAAESARPYEIGAVAAREADFLRSLAEGR